MCLPTVCSVLQGGVALELFAAPQGLWHHSWLACSSHLRQLLLLELLLLLVLLFTAAAVAIKLLLLLLLPSGCPRRLPGSKRPHTDGAAAQQQQWQQWRQQW